MRDSSQLSVSYRRTVYLLLELLFVTFGSLSVSCLSQADITYAIDSICISWCVMFLCLWHIYICTSCTIFILNNNSWTCECDTYECHWSVQECCWIAPDVHRQASPWQTMWNDTACSARNHLGRSLHVNSINVLAYFTAKLDNNTCTDY